MLIGENGKKYGVVTIAEALEKAQQLNIDLVQVSPSSSNPVVCKIMDYGKHIFAKKKIFHPQKVKQKEHH